MKAKASIRRAFVASFGLAVACIAALACHQSVALASTVSGPVWQSLQTYSAGLDSGAGMLKASACTGPGNCLAVGTGQVSGAYEPIALESGNGSWGTLATATVTGDLGFAEYASVACMSASTCVGVGYTVATGGSGEVAPIAGSIGVSGSTVTPAGASVLALPSAVTDSYSPEVAVLASVSCTASSCAAVGYYETSSHREKPLVATYSGGIWTLGSPNLPSGAAGAATLTAVSCPSDGPCEAVGNYIDSSGNGQSWALQLSGSEVGVEITPPGGATSFAGTLPTVPEQLAAAPDSTEAMTAISCPSAGACTALGTYPSTTAGLPAMAVPIDNGAVGAATPVSPPPTFAVSMLTGIWCADAGDCTVGGYLVTDLSSTLNYSAVTGYEQAGAWSQLTPLPGVQSTTDAVTGLGCSSLASCLVTGYSPPSGGSFTPFYAFSAAALSVASSDLPAATAGQPYSVTLQSSGGAGTSTWSITGGSLPAGLSLNTATGVISGTPTAAGSAAFTVGLASAGPPSQTASASLSIDVAAPPTTPTAPTSPTAPAAPAAPTASPAVSLAVGKVTASSVTLTVRCAGSGSCKGLGRVTAVEHFKGKRLTGVRAHNKTKTVRITLARGSYSLAAGQVGKVTLKLNAKARALLKRLHRISGTLTLTPSGTSKPTVTRTVTFRSATKKK